MSGSIVQTQENVQRASQELSEDLMDNSGSSQDVVVNSQNTQVEENALDVDLKDLYSPKGKFTPEQKIQAVMSYLVTGTSRKASKICGINEATIRDWKTRSTWWMDAYAECKKKKQEELDAAFTQVIHNGVGYLIDRMENGDTKFDSKSGQTVNVPMSGKDIGWVLGVLFDKRQLLRGEATSRSEKVSETERLDKLQQQFQNMAKEVQGYNAKVIEDVEYSTETNIHSDEEN